MAELKETCQKIKDFFKIEKIEDLPSKLSEVVFLSDSFQIYDDYIALVGGLETDYIQKSYQFWMSDRGKGSLQQDYTPPSIAKLVAELVDCPNGGTVLDCCAGSGALTVAKHKQNGSLKFVCIELDENVIPLLLFNLAIRGIEATVINGNILTEQYQHFYSVAPNGKYSTITEIANFQIPECDACISNPPYNISWEPQQDEIFTEYGMPPKNNANFAFVLKCLKHIKVKSDAAMILPPVVLSGANETAIRVNITKANTIKTVISLPDKMFESTSIATCIIVFNKNGAGTTISMINASETYHEEVRHQLGEAHNSKRTYHKVIKVLQGEDIATILKAVKKCENVPDFSIPVSINDLVANECLWTPRQYIAIKKSGDTHRPYADIVSDLRAIAKEKSAVKITMNETVAKKLGFDEVYEDVAKSEELTKQMNDNLLKLLGLEPIEENSWLTLSKRAGEIKIENTSKNSISSVIMMFLPMLKQHIYYLNDVENELLAELRDALLPDFMSGKINVM